MILHGIMIMIIMIMDYFYVYGLAASKGCLITSRRSQVVALIRKQKQQQGQQQQQRNKVATFSFDCKLHIALRKDLN